MSIKIKHILIEQQLRFWMSAILKFLKLTISSRISTTKSKTMKQVPSALAWPLVVSFRTKLKGGTRVIDHSFLVPVSVFNFCQRIPNDIQIATWMHYPITTLFVFYNLA